MVKINSIFRLIAKAVKNPEKTFPIPTPAPPIAVVAKPAPIILANNILR